MSGKVDSFLTDDGDPCPGCGYWFHVTLPLKIASSLRIVSPIISRLQYLGRCSQNTEVKICLSTVQERVVEQRRGLQENLQRKQYCGYILSTSNHFICQIFFKNPVQIEQCIKNSQTRLREPLQCDVTGYENWGEVNYSCLVAVSEILGSFLCSLKPFFSRLTETLLCFDKIYFSAANSSSSTFILLTEFF